MFNLGEKIKVKPGYLKVKIKINPVLEESDFVKEKQPKTIYYLLSILFYFLSHHTFLSLSLSLSLTSRVWILHTTITMVNRSKSFKLKLNFQSFCWVLIDFVGFWFIFQEGGGNLESSIEQLLNVEKQMRLSGEVAGTKKAATDILQLCFEARAWKTLNDQIILLSKRRGQLKQVKITLFWVSDCVILLLFWWLVEVKFVFYWIFGVMGICWFGRRSGGLV